MAVAQSSTEDLYDCPVCYEPFVNPRILNCGHSLCGLPKECLTKVLEMHQLCPKCRVPIGGTCVDDFPMNYDLMSVIEGIKTSKPSPNQMEMCKNHKLAKDFYCRACTTTLCGECWDQHDPTHPIIQFKKYKKEVHEKLLQSKLNRVIKLDKNIEDYQKIMSKCSKMEELLNVMKKLTEKTTMCIEEVRTASSCSGMATKISSFHSINEKADQLEQQFVTENYVILRELGNVLTEIEAKSNLLCRTDEIKETGSDNNDSLTKKFTLKFSPHQGINFRHLNFYRYDLAVAVDSGLNIYVTKNGSSEIRKLKATIVPSLSLTEEKVFQVERKHFTDIAVADNNLYAVLVGNTSGGQQLCLMNKDTFQVTKILREAPQRSSTGSTTKWSIKGKDTTLVLWVNEYASGWSPVWPSHLLVFKKDEVVKTIKIGSSDNFHTPIMAVDMQSVDQYLILLEERSQRRQQNSRAVIFEWDQFKVVATVCPEQFHYFTYDVGDQECHIFRLDRIPQRAFFPKFFSLGSQIHAIIVQTYNNKQLISAQIFTNAIKRITPIEVSFLDSQIIPIEDLSNGEEYGVWDRIADNVFFCVKIGKPQTIDILLLEITN